jgi:hypothetical protein
MRRGEFREFRAAAFVAALMAVAAALVAWNYHLPVRDPDGASLPTWFRLPVIVASAVALDILARWVILTRREGTGHRAALRAVLLGRWNRDQILFTVSGLVTWYVAYVAFRNLKSYVPFVTDRLADPQLARIDRFIWFGHDPALVMHQVLGTGWANWVAAAVYLIWIGLVPATLAIALVWTRRSNAGALYVTAISMDWCLGALVYYAVPSLGPAYSSPEWFASLPHTPNTAVIEMLRLDRAEVLAGPWDTGAVQTIAAFASLHVAVMVTLCLVVEMMRLPTVIRVVSWVFLGLTCFATVYLGWHFFVDVLGGAVVGATAFVLAARATGNPLRRRHEPWTFPWSAGEPREAPQESASAARNRSA